MDTTLEAKHRELETPMKKWLKYSRRADRIFYLALVIPLGGLSIPTIISVLFFRDSLLGYSTMQLISATLALLCSLIVYYAATRMRRKARIYRPNTDDVMLYYTCSILESLENHHKSKRSELKKEHREEAVKSGKELLSTLRKKWVLGDFTLAKKAYGDIIFNISDNLSNRVLPSLEKGDEETLKKLDHSLYQFAWYLVNPSFEGLQNTNKSLSENLDFYEPTKTTFLSARAHSLLKHGTVVGSIFAVGFFSSLLGLCLFIPPISIDTAFLIVFATFPVIAVYLEYVLKKK